MKKLIYFSAILTTLLSLTGCRSGKTDDATVDSTKTQIIVKKKPQQTTSSTTSQTRETNTIETNTETSDKYTNEQIEYARVWLSVQGNEILNPDISETLYVTKIPAGTLINPNDKNSITYPNEVIQLSAERLVFGSVTYTSNHDGSIIVYPVPKRWDSTDDDVDMQTVTQKIWDSGQSMNIEAGNDEEIKALIAIEEIEDK